MCYLDVIAGPAPIILGGTVVLAVAVGVLLLCGIALVTVGFIRANRRKRRDQKDQIDSHTDF